ncbi:response regulator [Sphingomonas sp. OTU376]|uniref:response regulator n=1 Tax=Sphingomonas sp. OTU376 TaxID=3043863 RepID=UPI00313C3C5C
MLDTRYARLLVVDDSRMIRRIIASMIHEFGIAQVDQAGDGAEALKMLRRCRYDLVISDWWMEPVSGFELLLAVRQDPALAKIPFLMITAERDFGEVINAKSAGATDYLLKPFTAETLNRKLDRFVVSDLMSPTSAGALRTGWHESADEIF